MEKVTLFFISTLSSWWVYFLFILFFMCGGCTNKGKESCAYIPDTSSVSIDFTLEQFEDSIMQFSSKHDVVQFFFNHPYIRDIFFNYHSYPNDSVFINQLYHRFTHPSMDTLLEETHKTFGDLSSLKKELTQAFIHMKYYYPSFNPPKIQTIITGLESDLYVSDSLIIIGLDYFIGSKAKYRPNIYRYVLRRYEKNFIVPSILLLFGIDEQYNKIDLHDKTVLADMIAYGKAYYFAKQMLPCTPDSLFIGYTEEEIRESKQYSHLIWKRLIEDEVLYSTSHLVKQKYINERPKTLEVGERCPGRIATWVGWEIIKKYMNKHSTITLPSMMNQTNATLFLKQSGYKPS